MNFYSVKFSFTNPCLEASKMAQWVKAIGVYNEDMLDQIHGFKTRTLVEAKKRFQIVCFSNFAFLLLKKVLSDYMKNKNKNNIPFFFIVDYFL